MSKEDLQRALVLKLLLPGDLLLYKSLGIMGRAIQLKTSSKVTHCEIYIGSGRSIASRDGEGVNTYDLSLKNLAMILRPKALPDMSTMLHWHITEAKGQGYDWVGLFSSFVARKWGRENQKMWCSEHTTRAYRRGGVEPFRDGIDADSIHPGDLFKSAAFRVRWVNPAHVEDLHHGKAVDDLDDRAGSGAAGAGILGQAQGEEGSGEDREGNR